MSFFLFKIDSFLVIAILLAFIPSIFSQRVRANIISKTEDNVAPLRRKADFYENAVCDIAYMKETRILGTYGYLKRLMIDAFEEFNKEFFRARSRVEWYKLAMCGVSLIGYGMVILYSINLLIRGSISAGAFAAVYGSLGAVFGIMQDIVNYRMGHMATEFGPIRNFIRFLALKESTGKEGRMDETPSVSIKNVSFRYPKAQHDSLSGVSLEIKKGETIAIVGENGAGKTTLVRLITGIYRPSGGEIVVGGLNTGETLPRCIYDSVTGVFQKYQRYKMTLDDNIRISQHEKDADITNTAEQAGVEIGDERLYPQRKDTMLSREFDGVDISGGQWQRVALARGFYRDHKLIVLDEPTAAIDPIEESKIYRQFMKLAKEKTAIIVTHRMGSATIADRVVVMEHGRINDIGTHAELMSRKGIYFEMFSAQAAWYEKSDTAL